MLYRRILFYYSVLISTLLLAWVLITQPKFDSIILLFMFLPVAVHFWLNIVMRPSISSSISSPHTEHKPQGKTLTRVFFIILLTVCISTLSILIYSASYTKYLEHSTSNDSVTLSDQDAKLKEILKRIDNVEATNNDISRQIDNLSTQSLIDQDSQKTLEILGDTDSTTSKTASSEGLFKVTDVSSVNVYADNTTSSQVIGTGVYNQIYTYVKKISGWYQIILPSLKQGWIRSSSGTEL